MLRQIANRETNPRNPADKPEKRQDDKRRRRNEEWPTYQRRNENWPGENFRSGTSQAQKGEGQTPKQQTVPSERRERWAEQQGEGTASYSNPTPGKEFGPGGRETSFGHRRARVSTRNAGLQSDPGEETPPENFGVSYDRGLHGSREPHEGAGGKIDSSQRDMGQTGEIL